MRVPSRFLTLAALAVFVALSAAPSARAEVLPGVIQPTLPPGTAGDDGTDSLTPFEEAVINVGNEILHHNDTIGEEGSDGVCDRTSPPPSPLPPCNLLATQASPLRSIASPLTTPPFPIPGHRGQVGGVSHPVAIGFRVPRVRRGRARRVPGVRSQATPGRTSLRRRLRRRVTSDAGRPRAGLRGGKRETRGVIISWNARLLSHVSHPGILSPSLSHSLSLRLVYLGLTALV